MRETWSAAQALAQRRAGAACATRICIRGFSIPTSSSTRSGSGQSDQWRAVAGESGRTPGRCGPRRRRASPNLFLASDYVRTYTDLATMEGRQRSGAARGQRPARRGRFRRAALRHLAAARAGNSSRPGGCTTPPATRPACRGTMTLTQVAAQAVQRRIAAARACCVRCSIAATPFRQPGRGGARSSADADRRRRTDEFAGRRSEHRLAEAARHRGPSRRISPASRRAASDLARTRRLSSSGWAGIAR